MRPKKTSRRTLITGLGTTAAAVALGTQRAGAQGATGRFQPARHAQDEWMESLPGTHRVVLDVVSADGMPDAVRFASNLFAGSKTGYDLDDADLALVVVLRHRATAYAYTGALWSKYGRLLDAAAAEPPTDNRFDAAPAKPLSGLARRGVHFLVCGTASLGIAQRLAGQNGDADAMIKEMVAQLLPNAHIQLGVAGVIGATRAQEYGYSYVFVG